MKKYSFSEKLLATEQSIEVVNISKMKPGDFGIVLKTSKEKYLGKIVLRTTMNNCVILNTGDIITSITPKFGIALLIYEHEISDILRYKSDDIMVILKSSPLMAKHF